MTPKETNACFDVPCRFASPTLASGVLQTACEMGFHLPCFPGRELGFKRARDRDKELGPEPRAPGSAPSLRLPSSTCDHSQATGPRAPWGRTPLPKGREEQHVEQVPPTPVPSASRTPGRAWEWVIRMNCCLVSVNVTSWEPLAVRQSGTCTSHRKPLQISGAWAPGWTPVSRVTLKSRLHPDL